MRRTLAIAGRASRFATIGAGLLLASLILPPLGDRPGGVPTFVELLRGCLYGVALLGGFRWLLRKITDREAVIWGVMVLLCAAVALLISALLVWSEIAIS